MEDGSRETIHSFVTLAGGTAKELKKQFFARISSYAQEIVAFRSYAAKRAPDVDITNFLPDGNAAQLEELMKEKVRAIMSDAANAAKATSNLVGEDLKQDVTVVTCLDHAGDNTAKAATKADDSILIEAVGRTKDPEELYTTSLVNNFLFALGKQFSHGPKSYARGVGVVDFRHWMQENYPGEWLGLKRTVGNRYYAYLVNAGTVLVMMDYYTKHLHHKSSAKTDGLNKMEKLLLRQCGSAEIKTILCAA
jgi:hypothetical protein